MPNFPRSKDLNALLQTSFEAVEAYNAQLTSPRPNDGERNLLTNIQNILADTRGALQKQLQGDSVVHIDPKTIRALEQVLTKLLKNPSLENRVNAAYVMQGVQANVPFLNELRCLQQLLQTVEGLKRGKRVSSIEVMEDHGEGNQNSG